VECLIAQCVNWRLLLIEPFGTLRGMSDIHDLIRRVDAYAKAAKISPAHVCRLATGNSRLYPRLKRRASDLEKLQSLIDGHISKHPVADSAGIKG